MENNPNQGQYPNQNPYLDQGPYPNQQPYMGQPPYPNQQMVKPPKQPMNPAKKKKLILGLSLGGVALVLGIAATIIVPILLRVDYSSAYSAAQELKPKVYDIYHSYNCSYVVDYVNSSYITPKAYNEYIVKCKDIYSSSISDSIAKLENTDGVKRNNEINAQFSKFKSGYDALQVNDTDSLSEKLALWQAMHDFVYAADNLSYDSSSDSEITTVANYLINSGNDVLKEYGEGWLEKTLAAAAAYRAYRSGPWNEIVQLIEESNNKEKEKNDFVATNKPDINNIAPLNFNDTSKMYSDFMTLYELITSTYQNNYNYGSGDCTEFLGEVYCE